MDDNYDIKEKSRVMRAALEMVGYRFPDDWSSQVEEFRQLRAKNGVFFTTDEAEHQLLYANIDDACKKGLLKEIE